MVSLKRQVNMTALLQPGQVEHVALRDKAGQDKRQRSVYTEICEDVHWRPPYNMRVARCLSNMSTRPPLLKESNISYPTPTDYYLPRISCTTSALSTPRPQPPSNNATPSNHKNIHPRETNTTLPLPTLSPLKHEATRRRSMDSQGLVALQRSVIMSSLGQVVHLPGGQVSARGVEDAIFEVRVRANIYQRLS